MWWRIVKRSRLNSPVVMSFWHIGTLCIYGVALALILSGNDMITAGVVITFTTYMSSFQDPFIFKGTVIDNIRYGKWDATDEECIAAERLKEVTQEELTGMLIENADEPYAEEIAATVMTWFKKGKTIETTRQMKEVIEEALVYVPKAEREGTVKKSCARTFQALRIDVNSEFEVLYAFWEKLPEVLAPNGRVAILTFHSGENRLVKRSFKQLQDAGIYSEICKDVIRPSAEECVRNSRAKSTKMRWAIRACEF